MPCQAPRKPSNQEKLMLGTTVGTKTITQMRFHTASAQSCHSQDSTIPPSTFSVWPVTKAAASDTRNSKGPVRSCGVPTRRRGVTAAQVAA